MAHIKKKIVDVRALELECFDTHHVKKAYNKEIEP